MGKELPISQNITTRDGTLAKDSYMENFYPEPDGNGGMLAVLRPGLKTVSNNPNLGAGAIGLGIVQGQTGGRAVFNVSGADTVYQIYPPTQSPAAIPSVVTQGQPYYVFSFTDIAIAEFFLYQGYGFNGLWYDNSLAAPDPAKITNNQYPTNLTPAVPTVPGIVLLDQTFYVMTAENINPSPSVGGGVIYGSALGDFGTWTALNTIIVDQSLGNAVALSRHLQYVVAFMAGGIAFYYDAANPSPGSPLSLVANSQFQVGCAHAGSIAHVEQLTIFMSKGQSQAGRSIQALSGLTLIPLSNNYIDKILDSNNINASLQGVMAYGIKIAGHSFYVLTLTNSPNAMTLVYDIQLQTWTVWGNGTSFFTGTYQAQASNPGQFDFIQGLNDGNVYQFDPTSGNDNGSPITGTIVTTEYGNGYELLRAPTLSIIGDTVSENVNVSYSDDDYNTWSTPVAVVMSYIRKQITRLGSFRRRAFTFTYAGGVPIRLKSFFIGKMENNSKEE